MADTIITLGNINELAQAATKIGDGDYIYIFKAGAGVFSKIEKNVFFQGIAASANAGIDSEAREKIEAMWAKINELIGDLANLAFSSSPTSALGELDWDSSAPVVPSEDPTLTLKSGGVTLKPTNDFTVGQHTGSGVSKTISVQGANLTENLTIAVTGSGFSVSTNSISASDANNGTTFTITFNGTTEGQTTGTLIVSSSEVSSGTITTKGSYIQQGGGDPVDPESYQVSAGTLSHVQITETLPATVSSGGSFTGHLVADSGYILPSSIVVSGTHGTVSYDQSSGVFTIPNITSNVAISAEASIALVKGQYIAYQGTSPKTPSNASLYTDICCMTAVLSVDFSDIDETVWETAYIEWVHGGIASKGNISFTKNNGTTAESVQGASSEKDTYSVDNMTSQTLSYWKQRRTLVNGLIATFKYDTSTNKVASGCCVVLKDANGNILKTLISANDLQGATFVTE